MESQGKSPDVIIGIDFGMTCTGVAYSCGPDWHLPKTIQNWPGKCLANKVATTISYCDGKQDPVSWGFQAESGYGEGTDTQRDFKLFLDPAYQNGCHGAPTPTEAEQYFRDYLHCIYKFIQQYFKRSQPHWATKTVEYVFSVPTTWKHPSIVAGIQRAIQAAGFGSANEHTARVTLTEAEAAAVYVAKENYQTDDVFMVCDAGGGTTDVNILKVMASGLGVTRLQPLSHVEGLPVGSTIIDYKMAAMIEDRLRLSGYHFQTDVGVIADEMVRDKFEMFKCSFGSDASNLPFIPLPVPELPPRSNHPQAGIQGSAIMLPREDLKTIFDDMFDKLASLIDEQLESLWHRHGRERVSYLILSGGLGSSPYLGQRLRERYESRVGVQHPNAPSMRILYAAEPQLAVCHGLVMDRVQEIVSRRGTYTERCCRVSYGIIVRELYDPKKHCGANIEKDERDKKTWAKDQIHWLVKQGEAISVSEGVKHLYSLKLGLGCERMPWKTRIVMSTLPSKELPDSMRTGLGQDSRDVAEVCTVESQLHHSDMKLMNRHWYNSGAQYWRAEFELRIVIGPADLVFEVYGKDGNRSKSHDTIRVTWSEVKPPLPT